MAQVLHLSYYLWVMKGIGKYFSFVSWSKLSTFSLRRGLFSDRVIFWSTALSSLIIIILLAVIFFKLRPGSAVTALHYNILIGVDVVNKGWFVYQLPLLAGLLTIYNLVLAKWFHKFEPFASQVLSLSSVLVSAMLLVAALTLVTLP